MATPSITVTTTTTSELAKFLSFFTIIAQAEQPFILALTHSPTTQAAEEAGIVGLEVGTLAAGGSIVGPSTSAPNAVPAWSGQIIGGAPEVPSGA